MENLNEVKMNKSVIKLNEVKITTRRKSMENLNEVKNTISTYLWVTLHLSGCFAVGYVVARICEFIIMLVI